MIAAILMAKLPAAGRVKTRLCPPLSHEQAAGVHAALLGHMLRRLSHVGDVVVWAYTGGTRDEAAALAEREGLRVVAKPLADVIAELSDFESWRDEADGPLAIVLHEQSEGDLGDRLDAAAKAVRPASSLFFGIDSPRVPDADVVQARQFLSAGRGVIGPCDDGGFWCLGTTEDDDVATLCRGVEWSSGSELFQVEANASKAGRPLYGLPSFWDVDRPADLARLLADLSDAPAGSPDGRLRDRLLSLSLPNL